MKTHFIDESVLSEYQKLEKSIPEGDGCVLFIDNHTNFIHVGNKIYLQEITFSGVTCKCFLYNSDIHDKSGLPLYSGKVEEFNNFSKAMWYNADYPFYIIQKYFPDFDYYWQIEYDVFCNGKTYKKFFNRNKKNKADLLCSQFRALENTVWGWKEKSDWVYKDAPTFGVFFPVVRLSKKAIEFLYNRRLEHSEIFKTVDKENNRWIFCELFVPTELQNNGFTCSNLDEPHLRFIPNWNFNKQRVFEHPDDMLYHPVK
jgi:hypothetical protein